MDSSAPSRWSTLENQILQGITKRLDCIRTQILMLRAVCSAWRSIVSIPPNTFSPKGSTLKLPSPNNSFYDLNHHEACCLLKESTIYYVEPLTEVPGDPKNSMKYWFVRIEETESGKVRLMDPLSRLTKKNFSDINRYNLSRLTDKNFSDINHWQMLPMKRCKIKTFIPVINLLNYRVTEVIKTYDLVGASFYNWSSDLRVNFSLIKKVVVGYDSNSKFSVMALYNHEELEVWKMDENEWVQLNYGSERKFFQDISYQNGSFYAVDDRKSIIAVDLSSLEVTLVVPPMADDITILCFQKYYLVNSLGDLYLIQYPEPSIEDHVDVNSNDHTFDLEVYKLNEEQGKWISVNSLGNQVMFVGDGCSFSVSATEFVGLKGNCIFKVKESRSHGHVGDFQIWNASLSDLEDQTAAHPLRFATGWLRSFWPPPTWLKVDVEERVE
ncbi:hypothetical protein FNV43_RR06482 [Rhamnella rubrinervis]|uniref:KIB1-4 beta-propeller domain-containing protein n=1 Tax=Rhamnella rubrinervis TaxID=2594499 RepID=A0A8K0HDI0_9ROSA|nr:hypothetical protein FNV43_RR06482 [Rhamnella rubrinervis]